MGEMVELHLAKSSWQKYSPKIPLLRPAAQSMYSQSSLLNLKQAKHHNSSANFAIFSFCFVN
jgi:hypothetical protein